MGKKGLVQKNVKLPAQMWNAAEELIKCGKYASEAELIRTAIRLLLEKEGVEIGVKASNKGDDKDE